MESDILTIMTVAITVTILLITINILQLETYEEFLLKPKPQAPKVKIPITVLFQQEEKGELE